MDFMVSILKLFGVVRDDDERKRTTAHRRRQRAELRRQRGEEIHALMRRRAEERRRWEIFWAIKWGELIGRTVGDAIAVFLKLRCRTPRHPRRGRQLQPMCPPTPAPLAEQIKAAMTQHKQKWARPSLRPPTMADLEKRLKCAEREHDVFPIPKP